MKYAHLRWLQTVSASACILGASLLTTTTLGCGANPNTAPANTSPVAKSIWVSTWADAPDSVAGGSSAEQTFREIVKPTVGSRGMVRLHFSNYFGTKAVTLGAVHVGVQTSGAGVTSDTAVTFNGATSATIPAGGFLLSDTLSLNFSYGSVLAVTEYVSGSWTGLNQHSQGENIVTSYATAANAGNKTLDTTGTSFTQHTFSTFLLDRVDVYGNYAETIAAFGSSTTDGYQSGVDQHMTYPEQLAAALHAKGRDDVGIANVGIYGTTVLGSQATSGVNRFSRDVLGLPGVTAVIDYLGANDLRDSCVQANTLIAGKQNLIAQAHTGGLSIYLAITAPSTFCGAQNPSGFGTRFTQGSGEEAQRFLLLGWEKATQPSTVDGTSEPPPGADAVIDFNGVLADPANLSYMLSSLDSGDDIHPNATGYGVMANAIPLTLF